MKLLGAASLVAVMAASAGCGSIAAEIGSGQSSHARSWSSSSAKQTLPLPKSVVRRLPPGVFYFLAGPNFASCNIWEVSRAGDEIELTRNKVGYGISMFGASRAGVVMADASSGLDELARLTDAGAVFLGHARASSPSISTSGQIISSRSPATTAGVFDLVERNTWSAADEVLYSSRAAITMNVWGPGGSIAILAGGHPPGTAGPHPRLLVRNKNGRVTVVRTGLGDSLGGVIWGPHARDLAAISWSGAGELIKPSGRRVQLPNGWRPAAWSPSGGRLLVQGPHRALGLWSPSRPGIVKAIGQVTQGVDVANFIWLSGPVRL